jgi:hypothetical protein
MKKFLLLVFLTLISITLFGQTGPIKQKYPQVKYYRGDSVVIITIDQSRKIDSTFKSQVSEIDSFKSVTDTLVKYRDSVVTKYVYTDSVLLITDSLRRELLMYKKKVEEAARLGLYVTYDTIREQAKFLPFDKDFKVNMKETENGVKLFATSFDQYTKTRISVGCGLAFVGGLSRGFHSEIHYHPVEIRNTFPNLKTDLWYLGNTNDPSLKGMPTSWRKETRIGNIVFKSDMAHISNATFLSSVFVAFPISMYETTTWSQVIKRSLLLSLCYTTGYNVMTKGIVR